MQRADGSMFRAAERPRWSPSALARFRDEFEAARQALIGRRAPELEGQQRPAWQHILVAIGGAQDMRRRAHRLAQASFRLAHFEDVRQRLEWAAATKRIAGVPTRAQLLFGGVDMLRFLFEPGARATDAQKGIDLTLHRVLRLLGDPVSWLDPGGVTADREQVLDHITEEFHFSPAYDLQLLAMFPDGLPALERRCAAILDGSHPRAALARARVPREDYHAELLAYAQRATRDPDQPPPRFRSQGSSEAQPPMDAAEQASFLAAAAALSHLWGFLDYCQSLPTSPVELVQRARTLTAFPTGRQYPR